MPQPSTAVHSVATSRAQLAYLPGLDGLRALAVLAVLLYHADTTWLPGGFLGVQIFFVISGYLITALLVSEWRQSRRIDVKQFWLRRARRLFPALAVLIAATLAFAVIFLPEEVAGLRADALAALGYVTNWYLVSVQESYFEFVGRPSMLQHLWSLAVEEQFYLLWPVVLAIWLRWGTRRGVMLAAFAGAALSALLMAVLYQPDLDPSRVYYGTDTRVAALLIGAALALLWVPRESDRLGRLSALIMDSVGLIGLGVLVWASYAFDQYEPGLYVWGFSLVALVTALVIASSIHPSGHLGTGLLDHKALSWVGVRSYSIYLWHWPVYSLTRPQVDVPLDGLPLFVLRLCITLVLAELSFRFVETPARQGALGRLWDTVACGSTDHNRWRRMGWGSAVAVVMLLSVALGASVASAQRPLPPAYLSANLDTAISDMTTPPEVTFTPTAPATGTPSPVPSATPTVQAPPKATPPALAAKSQPLGKTRVTAIGDSIMLGAASELAAIGTVDVDAVQGRQASGAISVVKTRLAENRMGSVVVIHIGNNGPYSARQFDEIMRTLASAQRVVVVNARVARQWEGPNNTMLANSIKQYPNARLVDWYTASSGHPEYFWKDGMHLRAQGAQVYAALIAASITAP